MGRQTYVAKNLRNVSPPLRRAVVEEAHRRHVTLSDVVGEIVADAWDMSYELSGETTWPELSPTSSQITVLLPQDMVTRVYLIARQRGVTESSVVQELIADRFGIAYTPAKRGGVWRRRS